MGTLLTVQDVAVNLGVSVKTVTGYIRRGEMRALRGIGRGLGYRVKPAWVEEFLRGREARPLGPAKTRDERPGGTRRADAPSTPFVSLRDARERLGLLRGGETS